jgi:hypothetical protein
METLIRKVLTASHLPDITKKKTIITLFARSASTLSKPDASLLLNLGLELKTASVLASFNYRFCWICYLANSLTKDA